MHKINNQSKLKTTTTTKQLKTNDIISCTLLTEGVNKKIDSSHGQVDIPKQWNGGYICKLVYLPSHAMRCELFSTRFLLF